MVAALLDTVADYLADELAAGTSARWLVIQACASVSYVADMARGVPDDEWEQPEWTRLDVRPVRPYLP